MKATEYREPNSDCDMSAQRTSQVKSKLKGLEGAVCEVEMIVDQLEDRLQTVVVVEPQLKDNKAEEVTTESLVPLAGVIDTTTKVIERIYFRMHNLLNRIEL